MTTDDPWSSIPHPLSQASRINARRVSTATPWGLYWAVDIDQNALLILQHDGAIQRPPGLPRLRGLQVETQPADDGSDERIIIRLIDREQRDIFLRFCQDIVEATMLGKTEEQAVQRFLARTWRWHRLLQRGHEDLLSDDRQKGLIGELLVLEKRVLPVLGALDAARCWTGPLGAPHDFEISGTHIEAKAHDSGTPRISVSSEHQLALGGAATLFLHVVEMTSAVDGAVGALTITDFARRVRSLMAHEDMAAVEILEARLEEVGFYWTDDYSDKLWLVGGETLYEVRAGFPRITPQELSSGIGVVRYRISLPECEAFRVATSALTAKLSGAIHDS